MIEPRSDVTRRIRPNPAAGLKKKALAERILNAEMDQHPAAERANAVIGEPRNHRNGHSRKTVLTGTGKLDLQAPRDRQASFEPQLIAKYRRRFPDFDDKVVSLYARGMTVREIQAISVSSMVSRFLPTSSAWSPTPSWSR